MGKEHYDLVVIGGGPGGYPAAIYAAKNNLKVALIEEDKIGGTCLNRGCIPTKTFVQSASTYRNIKEAGVFGLSAGEMNFDWTKIVENKKRVVKELNSGVKGLLRKSGVTVYEGRGSLLDEHRVKVEGKQETELTADSFILATGSTPAKLPVPGTDLDGVINSNHALDFDALPKSLVIVGGGVIGVEFAYVFNTFNVEVTIIEMLPEILANQDKDVTTLATEVLTEYGVKVHTAASLQKIEEKGDQLEVFYQTADGQKSKRCEKVLLSVGRSPRLDVLGDVSVQADKRAIETNAYMQTNIPNIYAVGDVVGKYLLAHVATSQALVAVDHILGKKRKMSYDAVPSGIYINPEIGAVGMTEQEAKEKYGQVLIGNFPMFASGKAKAMREKRGFFKIICEPKWKQIVGAHIVGPNATELIAEVTLAMTLESTVEELAQTIHAHPTLAEGLMEASLDVDGLAIHM